MKPVLFISHGAPNIILYDSATKANFFKLSQTLDKPKYIIMVSAHWTTPFLEVISDGASGIEYDFYGFEKELYSFKYDIKNDRSLTQKLIQTFEKHSMSIGINQNKIKYDHGIWAPLSMMYNPLDIPVIQLSLPLSFDTTKLLEMGEILQSFKDEAMIICSGSITHNLQDMSFKNREVKPYAKEFNEAVKKAIENKDMKRLLNFQSLPYFHKNHPTSEHFLPLFIALGASKSREGSSFNQEFMYSNISMESFIFKG